MTKKILRSAAVLFPLLILTVLLAACGYLDSSPCPDGHKWMYVPSSAADCCDDVEAVAAFDATFPEKNKKWMPSQEEFYIYSHSSVVR